MKLSRTPFVAGLAAVGVAAAALPLSGCKADAAPPAAAKAAPGSELPTVSLTTPRPVQAAPREEVTGTLFPAQALQVGFEVGGRLEKVRVKKGQTVQEGQVLAQLNAEISDAQLAQAQAAVAAAEVSAAMAALTSAAATAACAWASWASAISALSWASAWPSCTVWPFFTRTFSSRPPTSKPTWSAWAGKSVPVTSSRGEVRTGRGVASVTAGSPAAAAWGVAGGAASALQPERESAVAAMPTAASPATRGVLESFTVLTSRCYGCERARGPGAGAGKSSTGAGCPRG